MGFAFAYAHAVLGMVAAATVVAPSVTSLSSPSANRWSGAQSRTLTGTGFTNLTTVDVGGVNAPAVFVNSTTLTVTFPRTVQWENGSYTVTVANGVTPGTGSASWTVAYGPDIKAHWRGDLGIAYSSGAKAQVWADQVTGDANRNFVQLDTNAQGTAATSVGYNGQTVLTFAALGTMKTGTWAAALTVAHRRYMVCNFDPNYTIVQYIMDGIGASNRSEFRNQNQTYVSASSGTTIGITTGSLPTPTIWSVDYTTASGAIRRNAKGSAAAVVTGNIGTETCTGLTLGGSYNGSLRSAFMMAEIVLPTGIPTTLLDAEIMDYLGARYAITVAS